MLNPLSKVELNFLLASSFLLIGDWVCLCIICSLIVYPYIKYRWCFNLLITQLICYFSNFTKLKSVYASLLYVRQLKYKKMNFFGNPASVWFNEGSKRKWGSELLLTVAKWGRGRHTTSAQLAPLAELANYHLIKYIVVPSIFMNCILVSKIIPWLKFDQPIGDKRWWLASQHWIVLCKILFVRDSEIGKLCSAFHEKQPTIILLNLADPI